MDDLEFRKRAYSNPNDVAADFIHASESSPQRKRLVNELRAMEHQLDKLLHSVAVPEEMAEQLKLSAASIASAASADIANTQIKSPVRKSGMRRYYALAASLVVAVGLTLTMQSGPSAQDMEFHDNLLSHLYREEPRYDGNGEITWQQISQVVASAGGHLKEDERIKALRIKFVNFCGVTPEQRGAHIVLEGSLGSVSVFLVKDGAVTQEFQIKDERFAGKIVPFGSGNLIIVGEKEEPIDSYQSLITENFEWVI